MRKSMFFRAVVICLTIILTAGCSGSGGDEEPAGSVQAGEKLFKQATIGNQAGCGTLPFAGSRRDTCWSIPG